MFRGLTQSIIHCLPKFREPVGAAKDSTSRCSFVHNERSKPLWKATACGEEAFRSSRRFFTQRLDLKSMASSSSSTAPSSERTSHFNSQTEMEMESSKARHWSQLDYSTTDWESSAETNSKYFALLKEDPQWGRFFTDFETLEVGEKISEGAQADIYEARMTRDGPFNLVVKVMKGDAPLKAFQAQWPIGMLSARSKYKHLYDLPLITILGGTVLHDQRLRGRFAFVMYRRWGDLRLLIDRRMKQKCNTLGPFSMDEAIHLMLSIAKDMYTLHNKHDILHRDLKASNVLVWGEFGEDLSLVGTPNRVARVGSLVADFECFVGVLGTGFWRAPEVLEQLKARVPSAKVRFTHASDVYSYAMTCYEIVTGCTPYDGMGGEDMISQILQGQRPKLPHELPEFVRNIIVGCWHSDPLERPTFSTICMALKLKSCGNPVSVVIDNASQEGVSIVKVEQWNNPQPLTMLEVMQKLMDMDLLVLKAFASFSTEMIMQSFEVTNCKGKKVVDGKSIANITETLSLPVKLKWTSENLETCTNENTITQMHVIDVVAMESASFLGAFSRLLVASNFQVHSAGCCTRKNRMVCVIYVEGARMGTLLWELQHNYSKYFGIYVGPFNIIVHRVAAEEFSHLSRRLHNLNSMDLTLPRSSVIHVHQRKNSQEFSHSPHVVVCHPKSDSRLRFVHVRDILAHVSDTLAGMDYKIVRARIEYPGPFKFLKNRSKDIRIGTGIERTWNMNKILEVASERKCPQVNVELSVSGPSEELQDDLMRSLRENGLGVTGGQVYLENGFMKLSLFTSIIRATSHHGRPSREAVVLTQEDFSSLAPGIKVGVGV